MVEKAEISECYNKATILKTDTNYSASVGYVGGITGGANYEDTEINSCYNLGEVNSTGTWTAGISGIITRGAKMENCYNKGNIIANQNVGGISGLTYYNSAHPNKICQINNCYNLGNVVCRNSGQGQSIGGVLGLISPGYTKIDNCYNQGSVTETVQGSYLGGIIGRIDDYEQITVTNCSTTMAMAIGSNAASNATITNVLGGQTNLPSILSVVNTDSDGTFVEDTEGINDGYPVLKWQTENIKK